MYNMKFCWQISLKSKNGIFFEVGFCNESLHEIPNDKSVRSENILIEQKHAERNRGVEETHQ